MPPMPSLGPLINRVLRPLRGYYNRTPGFERIVNRAVWSVTVPWRDLPSAGEKVRLLTTVRPYTMVHGWGLSKIYELCREIERRGILGAYAECGVWKGGCGGVMGYWAAKSAARRKVWLFDSFEGLPEPTPEDTTIPGEAGAPRREGRLRPIGRFVASVGDVHELLFATLGLDPAGRTVSSSKKGGSKTRCPGPAPASDPLPCCGSTAISTHRRSAAWRTSTTMSCRAATSSLMTILAGPGAARPWMNISNRAASKLRCGGSTR